jgi:hypothetical protein
MKNIIDYRQGFADADEMEALPTRSRRQITRNESSSLRAERRDLLAMPGKGKVRLRKMSDEKWVKTLEDGRRVQFVYRELPEDGAFITAQIERNEVVYSVVLAKAKNPLSREDVESHFKGELAKK